MINDHNIHYLALLRGINVGGNNIIKMADLKACFESMNFTQVVTYIQSGNVIFECEDQDKITLTNQIENELSVRFNYNSKIVLITQNQLKTVVSKAPEDFGAKPEEYRYDVLFLKEPLTSAIAIQGIVEREGVDHTYEGEGVLYFSRLISKAGQSYLNKIIALPIYKSMTIRNWNTTTKLLELMNK